MDHYPETTMKELSLLEGSSNAVKEVLRKEFPVELKKFLTERMGITFMNLTKLLESYFAMVNDLIDMNNRIEKGTEQNRQQLKELTQLKEYKREGELYELVEKIRATGGSATISVTLPDSTSK